VVLITDSEVKSRMFRSHESVDPSAAAMLSTAMNLALTENRLEYLLPSIARSMGTDAPAFRLADSVLKFIEEVEREGDGTKVHVEGAEKLLNMREYQDAGKARELMEYLSDSGKIMDMLEEAGDMPISIKIGPELGEPRAKDASFVFTTYDIDRHTKGIIGIVASRLTEIFFRPAVVLTRDGDVAVGSARSVAGFDIYKAIESCRDILENFGGHTYASGLTLKTENVAEFKRRFEEFVDSNILPEQTAPTLDVDAMLDFQDINRKFFYDLKRFQPYGPCNTKPHFCTRNVYDYGTSKVVGRNQEHIKLELVDNKSDIIMNGIAFGQSSQARYIKTKRSFNIVYTIEENTHKRGDIQLQIEDIEPSEQD
jgi:single-stranded-DNA-specific exonuclease